MTAFTPVAATVGGLLIGASAVALLALNGRIAGISGILNGMMTQTTGDRVWRILFVVGLVLGGLLYQWLSGNPLLTRSGFSWPILVGAGLLVGFGTRLGSGCTSGHGVCGIARLSIRSLVATAVFITLGIVSTAVLRHALGLI